VKVDKKRKREKTRRIKRLLYYKQSI